MTGKKKKVFVALSGGVDSSTAGALLCENGFDCAGVFMITSEQSRGAQADAEEAARTLGIKLHILDLRSEFEKILDYLCSKYKKGRTPNPCVLCNRNIKFGRLWEFARENGAELLATGHYARIIKNNGDVGLYEAAGAAKDQSYVLSMIDKHILPYIILPMGERSKKQTRELAAKFGLKTANKPESQEICFIPDDNYTALLEKRYPELVRNGNIIDSSGKILGSHNGIHKFTIGQRRGLGVAMGKPYYVTTIDAGTNTVILGPKKEVMHRQLRATGVNWLMSKQAWPFRAKVKIRYNDTGTAATVTPENDYVNVEFDKPKSAITPGQLAVFYIQQEDKNRIVGGGWIDSAAN